MIFCCYSCQQSSGTATETNASKTPATRQGNRKDSLQPPKITIITAANTPKTVKAGAPDIRYDSLKGGAPFFTNYNTEQGLSLTEVTCNYTDRFGNIWFGTGGGGVDRYDGKKFTNYNTAHGLAGNSVSAIMQDKAGNMWFCTQGGGISKYDGQKFTNYTKTQGLASNNTLSIAEDKSGNIWIGTAGAGLSRFDGKTFSSFSMKQGLLSNYVQSILEDKNGILWFGMQVGPKGGGVSRYDGKTFTSYSNIQGDKPYGVVKILEDKSGNLWFATLGGGVTKYDGSIFTNISTARGLASNVITSIGEDGSGDLWFGTKGQGLSRYNGKTFSNYTTAQGLADNIIWCITTDLRGNLWFGTDGGGVSRYDGRALMNYTTARGMAGNSVWCITQDKSGSLWFATGNGGVSKYDSNRFTNYSKAQGLPVPVIWSIIQDRNGNLWFGTGGSGAVLFDGKTFTNYSTVQGLAGDGVLSMLQDKSGNIWFGSIGGAAKYDGKSITKYNTSSGLAGNSVYSMLQDSTGEIWFATDGGASRFDGKTFTNYTSADGLPVNTVLSILQDKNGGIWFGTDGGGASRYDGKTFKNFTTTEGLADNEVYAMAEDRQKGVIWFGTNLGISGLTPIPVSNVAASNFRFEIFNKNTGYPLKDLNTNAIFLDRAGILWMGGGDNKVIRFDYDAVNKIHAPLLLRIDHIKVNNEHVIWNNIAGTKNTAAVDSLALQNEMANDFGKQLSGQSLDSMRNRYGRIRFDSISRFYAVPVGLELPYADKNLTIDFTAIEPVKPKLVSYQYKLEGYDDDWSPPGNGTSAVFGNIPEGSYIFRLKARSAEGIWSETEYHFRVLAPWYRSWWAYGLYIVMFIGIVWMLVHLRSQKLRREKRILEGKVVERTRELNLEKDKVESALTDLKSTQAQLIQSEKMASLGELTAGIAHEIQNPLNFVNNFSEVSTELIDELKEELNAGNKDEALSIANNIADISGKIAHHGKRADAIVKSMLQHSRTSTGQREPADINTLTDEYLRLAAHGFNAKNLSSNSIIKTNFDEQIGKINIVRQDIGRVLLNLFNNALYATAEKKKQLNGDYEPAIEVTTRKLKNKIEIRVRDNGNGIDQKILGKIFQPFFTTKPTGQGTGLGLSLSYDIIKAHGGNMYAETKEGEWAEFIIELNV